MKGRKPLPEHLKVLHGSSKGKSKPTAPKPSIPTAPSCLDDEARAEWDRLTAELHAAGTITKTDRAVLAAFCQTWSRWCAAEQSLAETGPVVRSAAGAPVLNPYFSVSQRCLRELRAYAAELGLSPTSRTRLRAPNKPQSRLNDFLKNG